MHMFERFVGTLDVISRVWA